MKRKTLVLFCSMLAMAGASISAADAGGRKAQVPRIGSNEASKSLTTIMPGPGVQAPGVLMAPMGDGKAMTVDELISGMKAVKHGADGKDTVIDVPERLQKMLRAKKAMAPVRAPKGKLTQVKDTRVYPYSSFGLLSNGCTATTVMNNYALTAAYCLYDAKTKAFNKNLTYSPAISGDDAPVAAAKVVNMWVPKEFIDKNDFRFSYALVELDRKVGDETGWAGFGPVEGSENLKQLSLAGYPLAGVKKPGTMYETVCSIGGGDESFVVYACPGKTEQLENTFGAPMYMPPKGPEDGAYVQGIHIGPADDKKTVWGSVKLGGAEAQVILAWAGAGDTPVVDDEEEETDTTQTDTPECSCDDQGGTDTTDNGSGGDDEEDGGGTIGDKPKSN